MESLFDTVSTHIARAMGRPVTFIASFLLVLIWALAGPVFHFSDSWQLVINTGSSIVTFLMVFVIQNTQNRESDALEAKLDRLAEALEAAERRHAQQDRDERSVDEAPRGHGAAVSGPSTAKTSPAAAERA